MTTFVLVHSPHAPDRTWIPVANLLRVRGETVATPSFAGLADGDGPFWPRYVDAVASAFGPAGGPAVLVGHSGAGPLLPSIAARLGDVRGYVFVDATLPADGYRRDASLSDKDRASAAYRAAAARGEAPNPWCDPALWRYAGISDEREAESLAAATPRIPLAMNSEPIALPPGWPGAPCAYLAFTPNPFYASVAEDARTRGWPVEELPGAHFHMLVDPGAVADVLVTMV